jgi:hypothetical protein
MSRKPAILGLVIGMTLAWCSSASAGHLFHYHGCGHEERPHLTPEPGEKRVFCHTHERAGFPLAISNHAEPSNQGDSYGYYVGGGGGHGSGPRCREEGTFGWDYTGIHYPRNVILGWNHGRKYQGGTGAYKTDPPFEIRNIFAIPPHKSHHQEGEH